MLNKPIVKICNSFQIGLSENDQYIVAPIDKQWANENGGMVDEDDTQDPAEVEQQLDRVKDWINCYHLETIELINVLSNFHSISLVKTFTWLSGVKDQCFD
ncbi:Meiosis-specific protein ASY1 [Camellia lanceoleosa]|uniref:Meiosis-specific protein ASY1 n=1 Tax=Camellia lanceoleosa TaxID=1840588 RepID=A0ACC0GL55_9ERIC|nr:Meiosis-specific protein ASY1 [Camellia lanceoleosa]